MTDTLVVANTFIIVPKTNLLIFSSWNEVLSWLSDGQSVNFSCLWSIKHSNCLTVIAVPVSDLSIAASGEYLWLIWVIKNLLEHGWLEEAHHSSIVNDIPDDAGAIVWRRNSLSVLTINFDIWNSLSMFLQGSIHYLCLSTDSPNTNFTFHTSRDNLLAIIGAIDWCHTMIMSVINIEEKFTALWKECSDFSIVPSWQDALVIFREVKAIAFESRYFDSQELLSCFGVPDSDVIQTASGKKLWISTWENNIIDSLIMACISKFRSNVISVAPVNSCFWCSTEEMCSISSQRQWGNRTHYFCSMFQFQLSASNFRNSSISWSKKKISIWKELDGVDTLWEKFSCWTNSFEEVMLEWDFNNVSSFCSDVSVCVSRVNDEACEYSFDLCHKNLIVLYFLLDEITIPSPQTIIMNSQTFRRSCIEECNFVGNVHTNWVSNKCLSTLNLNT